VNLQRGTLAQYLHGKQHGLVPAGHIALRSTAEAVDPADINRPTTRGIVRAMHGVVKAMRDVERPIVGLAAPQVGEAARIVLVPREEPRGEMMVVYNPVVDIEADGSTKVIPHGCFSSNELFARLESPMAVVLSGLDENGEPLNVRREGLTAVSYWHEAKHLDGVRAADIACREAVQLDWRPPEQEQAYREYFNPHASAPASEIPDWHLPYPHEQWQAVRAGEFTLEQFAR
jgi:peptide deformylase